MKPIVQTVLFVDDEEYVLRSLKRICRNEDFQVLTAGSGSEALKLLENESVDLIVSDLRMPGMDGSELLATVSEIYPDIPRVLLSGNADLPSVIKTVNEGQLAYYFQKPWDDDAVRLTLRTLLQQKKLEEAELALTQKIQEQNEQLIELNETLERQSKTLLREAEIKSRFFSTMSHEIRTPLNGMLGVLQILNEDGIATENHEHLVKTCLSTATDLKRIADDVLDYSKLESNNMVLESVAFKPLDILTSLEDLMRPMAVKKGLEFTIDAKEINDLMLEGDPVRIRQIISNLVSNAIKYTSTGSVRVQMTYSNGTLEVSVADTGIGISPDRRKYLFKEFQMLDPAHNRQFGGTGLGLSIVKRLVDQMDGRISVSSHSGSGSEFSVRLPLSSSVVAPEFVEQISLEGKHFLVADDNEPNRLIIESSLERQGAKVTSCESGLAAISVLQTSSLAFDAILLDINMPELDGVETQQIIREDQLANCPIYAITAQIDEESVIRFKDCGFNAVLTKPIDLKHLVKVLSSSATTLSVKVDEACDRNKFDELLRNTGEDAAQPLVDAFTRDCESRAIAINDALNNQDDAEIARQAHALSNAAAMFGADTLYQLCRKVDGNYKDRQSIDQDDSIKLELLIRQSVEQVNLWLAER